MSENNGKDPEKKFNAGGVSATVWNNKAKVKGQEIDFKTVTLQRRYKDKEGNWQSTSNLNVNDLPKAELVARKAYEYIVLKTPQKSNEGSSQPVTAEEVVM